MPRSSALLSSETLIVPSSFFAEWLRIAEPAEPRISPDVNTLTIFLIVLFFNKIPPIQFNYFPLLRNTISVYHIYINKSMHNFHKSYTFTHTICTIQILCAKNRKRANFPLAAYVLLKMKNLTIFREVERRHPDLNWGSGCCRPTPYHLAIAPNMERITRLELATSTLARWRSTR